MAKTYLVLLAVAAFLVGGFTFSNTAVVNAEGPGKTIICHNDVDDDDPTYASIIIEISDRAVDKHVLNHGDETEGFLGSVGDTFPLEDCQLIE